jgi:hypothetical protein
MDTILAEPWTAERFLAWEDQQEGRHEFDGQQVVAMTGGSMAHQRIVRNLLLVLSGLVDEAQNPVVQEMRVRMASRVRYPDVVVCAGPIAQTTRTLTDALVIFEVLSDDTADTDRVEKLAEYAALPSLRAYVLLDQSAVAVALFRRDSADEPLTVAPPVGDAMTLAPLGAAIRVADLYRGLSL